jgi:hypothetical protein
MHDCSSGQALISLEKALAHYAILPVLEPVTKSLLQANGEVLAEPASSCRKFSAVRSAVSKLRAAPCSVNSVLSPSTVSPSCTRHSTRMFASTWCITSSTQGRPHIIIGSRVMMRAWPLCCAGMSCAVISPVPMSSASAARTCAIMSVCRC